jgi:2-desacetyl-2-hydroxyethyl bacteriochlorophyllide A dehydrogenase
MAGMVRFVGPRDVTLVEYPEPPLAPSEVRVATLYSGISAGTELTAYRGTNPYLNSVWDAELRLFIAGNGTPVYPLDGWGYEEVGRVVEVAGDAPGDLFGRLVWGAWGHRSSHVVSAQEAARRLLEDGVSPIRGIFARIGAISLNAVLDAQVNVGETVAVFGLGVPGLLVTQLCKLSGATVVAVDRVPQRLERAGALGADHVIDLDATPVAERVRELTGGRGADVSIEVSGSYAALHEAVRSTAYNSQVVCVGFLQGQGTLLRLGEEFHHNRIQITCSQTSGVSRHLDHRWTRDRLEQTVMRLIAEERLAVEPLVTHVLPAAQVAHAFELLDKADPDVLQVVIAFSGEVPA